MLKNKMNANPELTIAIPVYNEEEVNFNYNINSKFIIYYLQKKLL